METKELKIQVPEGYEIDKENSTFERIRFKPIKKDITYDNVCDSIFESGYYIGNRGEITRVNAFIDNARVDKNNATTKKQLEKLLALNQLLNIAEYYNQKGIQQDYSQYCIICENKCEYHTIRYKELHCLLEIVALFNRKEDAQTVIDNPNFREILDTIYKDK